MHTLILSLAFLIIGLILSSCSTSLFRSEREAQTQAAGKEPIAPDKKSQATSITATKAEGVKEEVKKVSQSSDDNSDPSAIIYSPKEMTSICVQYLKSLPGKYNQQKLVQVCEKVQHLQGCSSLENRPIFHYDKEGQSQKGKRILTMSLIHGDEHPSGTMARSWMMRLEGITSRNHWRVIPVMNPDGMKKGTRTNARGVDLNRNFPTSNWDQEALYKWRTLKQEDPRRYPGPRPASEVETRCAMKHIEEFKPHFIISIHTPLGLLDFDGPIDKYPRFKPLPWISLGHFPGSLGRYMWADHSIPVLTIELKGNRGIYRLEQFDRLQDISGTVAIQASKANHRNKKKNKLKRENKKTKPKSNQSSLVE